MSLYDDEELGAPPTDVAAGWSRGVQMMQAKKGPGSMGPPGSVNMLVPTYNKPRTSSGPVLAPVIDLKSKKSSEDFPSKFPFHKGDRRSAPSSDKGLLPLNDPTWDVVNEYDPLWPNDYHKVVEEMRNEKRKAEEDEESESRRKRYTEDSRAKARERFNRDDRSGGELSGFGRRPRGGEDDYSDEEDNDRSRSRSSSRRSGSSSGGAAIAPPPSLTETSNPDPGAKPGLGVAAKIMAKYGYKQGQGLGRSEQGMSMALSVEKTSKRGGRIVHEKDLMPPPMFGESFKEPALSNKTDSPDATPPRIEPGDAAATTDEYGNPLDEPPQPQQPPPPQQEAEKPTITDLMKNPSKVVLCKNMVGPGEVDDDLEPEIKEECHGKYGDVNKVVIYEIPGAVPEEAVRIFVEFKRVESAIKAVIDLNGRFFGGREVRSMFYNLEKFQSLKLDD